MSSDNTTVFPSYPVLSRSFPYTPLCDIECAPPQQKILFLELGVGYNTPVIIKYPFWQMTAKNPNATYACINQEQAFAPEELASRAIVVNDDVGKILQAI